MERCEDCDSEDFLYNTICKGRSMRLCKRCLDANGALQLKDPESGPIELKRESVRERLANMAGIDLANHIPIDSKRPGNVTLESLRQRHEEVKRQREIQAAAQMAMQREAATSSRVLDTGEFLNYLEKGTQSAPEQRPEHNADAGPGSAKKGGIRGILERMMKR